MTPEEKAAIEQYLMLLQSDPMARATNDYGQGAGFLQLDEQPESWDRMGEKNDLYSDLFRTTQTYLSDFIPDLYPEVEDPGQFAGYRSDQADLYRNNPAFSKLEQALAEGGSFDEVVSLIAQDPESAQFLPKTERGQVDLSAFRNSAETFVSERAREGREFDEYDAERQAYEDYVNPRTGWDVAPGRERDELAPFLRTTDPTKVIGQPNRPDELKTVIQDRMAFAPSRTPKNASPVPPQIAQRMEQVNRKDSRRKLDNNRLFNQSLGDSYEAARAKKEAISNPSKKQENNAKLVRAYNMLMYGE